MDMEDDKAPGIGRKIDFLAHFSALLRFQFLAQRLI